MNSMKIKICLIFKPLSRSIFYSHKILVKIVGLDHTSECERYLPVTWNFDTITHRIIDEFYEQGYKASSIYDSFKTYSSH